MYSDPSLRELATIAVVLGAALVACGRSEDGISTRPADRSDQFVRQAASTSPVADAALAGRVRGELLTDTQLRTARIAVESEGGRVTLTGSVPDEAAQQRASRVAAEVQGVRSVYNQLALAGDR